MFRSETTFWLQCDHPHEGDARVLSTPKRSIVEATEAAEKAGWLLTAKHKCPAHKVAPTLAQVADGLKEA